MKIGIVTIFHKNYNYGGLLQAYALTRFVNNIRETSSEQLQTQIRLIKEKEGKTVTGQLKKLFNLSHILKYVEYRYRLWQTRRNESSISLRKKAFEQFENSIPHSAIEYTTENIADCADDYDLFITGSDQVWNYDWYNPIFFLEFTNKRKISYAASIGHNEIPEEWKEKYRDLLKDFSAVSVREEEAVSLLQPLSPVPVEWVLDPTLLLSASDWDEICLPRQIDEPYLFCYFLGDNKRDRRIAETVAKRKGLQIVTLPHLIGEFCFADKNFGDIRLWDVSPEGLISLIKHADFVLTDSFHCSVFSTIYRRSFAVFERAGKKGMGGRLRSLTDLTDTQDRFLVTPEMTTADYICSLPETLPEETEEMKKMKEKSVNYLIRNIEAVRQELEEINAK